MLQHSLQFGDDRAEQQVHHRHLTVDGQEDVGAGRHALPALSNSLIGMIKDTSLASNITVAELFMAGQRVAARTYIFLPIYCEVAVVYLLFCTVVTKLQSLLERQLNAHGFQ